MKVTNISTKTLYLQDLRLTHASQVESRLGEDRYLGPGASVYFPNTSEVLRSVYKGELRTWAAHGFVTLEDTDTLGPNGGGSDTVVLAHNFGLPPIVYILKQVGHGNGRDHGGHCGFDVQSCVSARRGAQRGDQSCGRADGGSVLHHEHDEHRLLYRRLCRSCERGDVSVYVLVDGRQGSLV